MGREARAIVLPPRAVFGAVWKTCAREPFLAGQNRKRALLNLLNEHFGTLEGNVSVYGLAVLGDRYFLAASLSRDHTPYSNWVKRAHGDFAMLVNRQTTVMGRKRVGPVGRGRPTTSPVEEVDDFKRLVYAMAWAPVVAGEATHPSKCWANTYNLYAGGKVNAKIKNITFPQWYMGMGLTMRQRQIAFRNECDRWYREGLLDEVIADLNRGAPLGGESYRQAMRDYRKKIRQIYLDKVGHLISVTLRHGFSPTLRHGEAVGVYSIDLVATLIAHLVWAEAP